jgi:hypothetical protein
MYGTLQLRRWTADATAGVCLNRPTAPQTRHLLATELVLEAAREHADLTAAMLIVLQQIRQRIDRPARHPLLAGFGARPFRGASNDEKKDNDVEASSNLGAKSPGDGN